MGRRFMFVFSEAEGTGEEEVIMDLLRCNFEHEVLGRGFVVWKFLYDRFSSNSRVGIRVRLMETVNLKTLCEYSNNSFS